MMKADEPAAEMLHRVGHGYVQGGECKRGLVLLLLASQMVPAHAGILYSLTQAFMATGDARRALDAVERIASLQGTSPTLLVLKSRALWVAGQRDEARQCFRDAMRGRREE